MGRLLQFPPLPEIPEPLRGQSFAMVEVAFLGGKDAGDQLVEPLRALGPLMDTIAMVPPADLAGLHMDPLDPMPYLAESQLLGRLDEAGIDAFVAAAGPGSGSALTSAEIRHLGGALARPQDRQGALGTVDGAFLTFAVGVLAVPELGAVHQQALAGIAAALAPYDDGRRYLNFTETSTDAARFFGPEAYQRLRAVKAAYDPENRFRANHPIPAARASRAATAWPCSIASGSHDAAMAIGTGKIVRRPWITSNPNRTGMPCRLPATASRCSRFTSAGSVTSNSEPTSPLASAASTAAA